MKSYTFVNTKTNIPESNFYASTLEDAEANCPLDCYVFEGLLPITLPEVDPWIEIREIRSGRLMGSDWTQMPDVSLETKQAWAVYRQQLRDITNQPDPLNIVWPEPPVR